MNWMGEEVVEYTAVTAVRYVEGLLEEFHFYLVGPDWVRQEERVCHRGSK